MGFRQVVRSLAGRQLKLLAPLGVRGTDASQKPGRQMLV